MHKRFLLYIVLLAFIFPSCRKEIHPLVPESVRKTIDESGTNRIEFIKSIARYQDLNDTVKLNALYYLIENMRGHGYKTYLLQDSKGKLVDYNIREYDSYKALIKAKDSVSNRRGSLKFIRHYFGPDKFYVTAQELNQQVNHSYQQWKTNPWSKNYSFDMFCEKILPYRSNDAVLDSIFRINNEIRSDKKTFQDRDVFKIAGQVLDSVESRMSFDKRFLEHPTDRMPAYIKTNQKGRTEDAAALMVNMLRNSGIACAIDYVPYPGERGDAVTYWVVVWDAEGNRQSFYPFKDSLRVISHPVKVFRRTYHTYNRPLPDDSLYRFLKYHQLKDGKYKDVTEEYIPTTSWHVSLNELGGVDKLQPVFLVVQTNSGWLPIDWRYFTKSHLFRELAPGKRYALMDHEGNVLTEKMLPKHPE